MRITDKQKDILTKYQINYDTDDLSEMLKRIDWVMTDYVDEHDEPLKDFLILEKVYDEILTQN